MGFRKQTLILAAVGLLGVWACGDDSDDDAGDGDHPGDGDGDGHAGHDASVPSGGHTCADLLACCNTLSGSKKEECLMAYDHASASGEFSCNAGYGVYQLNGTCD